MSKEKQAIRQLFRPIQPTVRQSGEEASYREFLPAPTLQTYLYCYWELKTLKPLSSSSFAYRVVADGCIDIFFNLNDTKENFVMGFCKKYTEFLLEDAFHYFGLRFLPTMFPLIFDINAADLSNRFEQLELVIPTTAQFIADQISNQLDSLQICHLLDDYFINLLSDKQLDFDPRLYNAIEVILKNFGVLNIEKDLNVGLSSRQLRRIFQYYIGDTPKTFSKVVRFQNILKAKPSKQSLRQNKLFFDVGYYDQAHFIKEFKKFYGVTPSKAFGR